MANWPATLPDLQERLTVEPVSHVRRTLWTSGRARQREVVATPTYRMAVQWMFTDAQWRTFQTFARYTLLNGTAFFVVDLPFGNGLEEASARIIEGRYKASYQEPHWVVTASLEILDVPLMDEETFDFFVTLDDDLEALEAATEHLYNLVNYVMPSLF